MTFLKIKNAVNRIRLGFQDNPFVFALALLIFAIITYGIFIFKLGFYWDDWPPLLLSHLPDKHQIWQYFLFDRPFQSWTYYFLFPVCKDSAACWQFSGIFFRWTSALLFYHTFLRLFPKQKTILQWSAILFVVFPGFSNQFSSVSFSSHFIVYSVFAASLYTLVIGLQNKRLAWFLLPISYLLTAIHLFTMEYFVGLEVLRLGIIFYLTFPPEKSKKMFLRFLLNIAPYLAILAIFVYWRLVRLPILAGFIHDNNTPFLFSQLLKSPVDTIVALIKSIFSDTKFLFITSWVDRLLPDDLQINSATFWLSILIGILTSCGFYYLFSQKKAFSEYQNDSSKNKALIILGLVIVFFGLLPIWSTLRQVTVGKWSDRFSISAMLGVVLIILTLIFWIINSHKVKSTFLIVLIALSISYHIRLGNEYRKDYNRQKAFYTQLYWRIPMLQPGTTLYSPGIPTSKEADYSYSMGINMLYSSQADETLDYWFLVPRYVSPESMLNDPSQTIKQGLRIFTFEGSGNKVVSIHMPDQGCLWVINPYYALSYPDTMPAYAEFSNESLISDTTPQDLPLLAASISLEPQNTWCYYFEKIDLARSKGDLSKALELYETSLSKNLKPIEGAELLPVVQSYVGIGIIEKAIELTKEALSITPASAPIFCGYWKDISAADSGTNKDLIDSFFNAENCPVELQ
jgi:hypothetical protein